jgi:transglutaminase-like putative cysteine protease
MNIYDPNSKILRVNIPQVEVGDVVHTITRTTTHRPVIPGQFAEYNVFEEPGLIRHLSYEVYAPLERPLQRIVLRDEIPGTIKYSTRPDGTNAALHRWEVAEVPRMFDEPAMPPYDMALQRLLVSTTPDWQAISKWYWEVCKPHLAATTPELNKTVTELTAGAKSDLDKIKAVFDFVSKKIRYMGLTPEKDRPGFEPHDVRLTFDNKYGVCRDKAALLVAMLRFAGLNAYPVLVNVGSKKDPEVPEPGFNHAIVGVELKKGDYVLMDPTAENTIDLLPSYECDQSYLVSRLEGDTLRTSPIVPADQNMMRITTTATLTPAGVIDAKSQLWFDGINDNEYRDAFTKMKPDDRQRFFERNLRRSMPGAQLKSLKLLPEDMLDVSSALHAELEFSVDGMTACGGGKGVVSLPWLGKNLGIVNFILDGAGLEKRKYSLRTQIACGVKEDISIKLAAGFAGPLSMPAFSPVDDDHLGYSRSTVFKNGALACSAEFKLKSVEFSPAQYLKLKQVLKTVAYDERKSPVIAVSDNPPAKSADRFASPAPTVESNAKILESHKEVQIKDAHSQLYKVRYSKQILTYDGKKNEAEVRIPYNPACEEATLLRAICISKTGQRQEIAKGEINVMDADWNASAKRYTGGKILVANLPGVDIGSTIEVEFQISTTNKPFLTGFESFQLFDDLAKKDFQISAPASVRVQTLLTGPSGFITQSTNATSTTQAFQWRAENVKALPAETQLPPAWIYMAGVDYFAGNLKAYLTELNSAMLDRSAKSAKAGEIAQRLSSQASSRIAAVSAIRDHIIKSIRLAGPSFADLPLSELSSADTTLADGYGHTADRAILFHAMLSAAGFQPEFVLASSLPPIAGITNITATFPLPEDFQSPLVRVAVDGRTFYLNDTDQYARLGSTPHDGRLGLVLPGGSCEIIKAAPDCQDKTETVYTLSVADNGQSQMGIAWHYYGENYNSKKRFFSELPPEERRRYFQEIVSNVAQGARPVGDLATDFDAYPGVEKFTIAIDNYSVVDGNYSYFNLPFAPSLFPAGAERRALPMLVSRDSESTIRAEIELPPGFRHVDVEPRNQNLDAPAGAGKARITTANENGKCIITYQLDTSPAIVSPNDYPNLLEVESALARKSAKLFLLEK